MIPVREFSKTQIFQDFDSKQHEYWFDFKKSKFLHNVDTFYYSVKFRNDFTASSKDSDVLELREYFKKLQRNFYEGFDTSVSVYFEELGNLNLLPYNFSRFYTICLEKPEEFHIFIAPKIPKGSGDEAVTSEIIVQIRSYMLWMYGIHEAFKRSYAYVCGIAAMFNLQIDYVQENRVDYCWHSNYLSNPEKFFSMENFYKMRVDRFKGAHFNTEKCGSEDYLIDYLALGKRGQKCFVRIYLKSKEVIEMGYKPFFFKVWLFHGLINRYDLYCYEKAFKTGKWDYMDIARLEYYAEFGSNERYKDLCIEYIRKNEFRLNVTDQIRDLANFLTPKINLIMNVEYQTMRKASKSFPLIPLKDNSHFKETERIYTYLDNRYMISRYLTSHIFRLVEPVGDARKSRREDCGFWKELRKAVMPDMFIPKQELPFVRQYNRNLSVDVLKRQIINKSIVLGFYNKGINEDVPLQDAIQAVFTMNDNDMEMAMRYKQKKSRQYSDDELSGLRTNYTSCNYMLVNESTGEIYNNDSIDNSLLQGGREDGL
ncbi:hypothetical protein [uncultured Robinsoniella sp.]|uniref:hypothetical protein n=1 Tax=uncultured Robinsoniella sp. TaxID=904190 RepID=UPI00374EE8E1